MIDDFRTARGEKLGSGARAYYSLVKRHAYRNDRLRHILFFEQVGTEETESGWQLSSLFSLFPSVTMKIKLSNL
jgi:hypothetical protein